VSDQEKLNLCNRTNAELCAEKAHLERLLKKAEEQQEGLRVELTILAEEKAETQEKLSQVRPKTWYFWVDVWLLGSAKPYLLDSAVVLPGRRLVVLEVRRLCLLLFGNMFMACRAVVQFSELSSASTDSLIHLSVLAPFFGV